MYSRESESIETFPEALATASNPVMPYSIGKDSSVVLRVTRRALRLAVPQFPLLHDDTGWKSKAIYNHRDRLATEGSMRLVVHNNPQGSAEGVPPLPTAAAITWT